MSKAKTRNLKGLSLRELEEFAVSMGEKPFRGRQLFEWIYNKKAAGFDEMTDLPAQLRLRLGDEAAIGSIGLLETTRSADGTTKLLFSLEDGKKVESVLIPPRTAFRGGEEGAEQDGGEEGEVNDGGANGGEVSNPSAAGERLTLCVSTQVGCPLDCAFCATATMGFLRNLTAGEIVSQVTAAGEIAGRKITNIVFMGMGEPLLNYDEVMKSAEIISTGLKIAARRITVSTAGWAPGIRRMADEGRRVKLAVSLHTLDEAARASLMPVSKKYPLAELLDAAEYYYGRTKQRITFEYILFHGWNDSDADARRLAALMRRIPGKVNIIPFHSVDFSFPAGRGPALRPAPAGEIDAFARKLRAGHVTAFVRSSAGEDINAACGQLAVRHDRRRGARTPAHDASPSS
jgi:23S rRNA (adenine2503-C2)-methyltransferase